MGNYIKSIILIIVLLFLVTFGVKNSHPTQLRYYFDLVSVDIPLYGVVYLAIVVGIIIGMIVGIYDRIALRGRIRRLQRENRELKEKVVEEEKKEEETDLASKVKEEVKM
ncbi:MAG TPA: lipopolysaccharide assembly protein LapA domain-containing protein [Desulfatiglandales bacterium]|nr:lipopolysaccharide assembly protein LapA domain-containing protein [Desulfatiglandales bacterium]